MDCNHPNRPRPTSKTRAWASVIEALLGENGAKAMPTPWASAAAWANQTVRQDCLQARICAEIRLARWESLLIHASGWHEANLLTAKLDLEFITWVEFQ